MANGYKTIRLCCHPRHPPVFAVLSVACICIAFGPPFCLFVSGKVYRLFTLRQLLMLLVFIYRVVHGFGMVYHQWGFPHGNIGAGGSKIFFLFCIIWCAENWIFTGAVLIKTGCGFVAIVSLITIVQEVQKTKCLRYRYKKLL